MEAVLRELGPELAKEPEEKTGMGEGGREDEQGKEEGSQKDEAFRRAWEAMLAEGMDGAMGGRMDGTAGPSTSEKKKDTGAKGVGDDEFQKNIRRAMDRLKESDSSLQVRNTCHCPLRVAQSSFVVCILTFFIGGCLKHVER